jgi:hypothetical protein
MRAANVATVRPDTAAPSLERATTAWQAATRTHTTYLLHDADPLKTVADAWVRRFDVEQPGPPASWRSPWPRRCGAGGLAPSSCPTTTWCWTRRPGRRPGATSTSASCTAPSRVVPVVGTPERVGAQLGGLGSGRWWPEVDRLLDGIDRVVPDRVQPAPATDDGR